MEPNSLPTKHELTQGLTYNGQNAAEVSIIKGTALLPCSLWGHPSGRSQLPCHSDTSAALRRGPHGEELGPLPAATSVSGASLQMTAALANILMATSRKTLSQNHAANPLPDA